MVVVVVVVQVVQWRLRDLPKLERVGCVCPCLRTVGGGQTSPQSTVHSRVIRHSSLLPLQQHIFMVASSILPLDPSSFILHPSSPSLSLLFGTRANYADTT